MAEFQKLDTIDVQQLQADFEKYERAGCNVLPLNVTMIYHLSLEKNENFDVLIIVDSNRQKLPNSQNRQILRLFWKLFLSELMIVIFDILIGES